MLGRDLVLNNNDAEEMFRDEPSEVKWSEEIRGKEKQVLGFLECSSARYDFFIFFLSTAKINSTPHTTKLFIKLLRAILSGKRGPEPHFEIPPGLSSPSSVQGH